MNLSLAIISKIAKHLESANYQAYECQSITGEDLLLSNMEEIKGKQINPEENYILNVPVLCEVNHKRRLKKAYKSSGIKGIYDYLDQNFDPETTKEIKEFVKEYLK